MLPPPAHHVVIREDLGGRVDLFSRRVSQYLKRNVTVRVEGECTSACTMISALPAARLCVSPAARFGFHQAFHSHPADPFDATDRSEDGTAELLRHYPPALQAWIGQHGGLTSQLIYLEGRDLPAIFRICGVADGSLVGVPDAYRNPVVQGGGRLEHSSR